MSGDVNGITSLRKFRGGAVEAFFFGGGGGRLKTFSGGAPLKKTPCILTDDTISNPTLGLFNHLYFIVENPKTGLELQNTFSNLESTLFAHPIRSFVNEI